MRIDPGPRPRLVTTIGNLPERIQEAQLNGWLGEVDGLRTSLDAARAKLTSLDRIRNRPETGPVSIGMPTIK